MLVHQRIVVPGFRDQHHHGMAERVAAGHQQFQRIVEAGGIRDAVGDQRPELRQVVTQHFRLQRLATCCHPVDVAACGVDLAIVTDQAERVRQRPRREGIGGKPLMHQCQRRREPRVRQILEIAADLFRQQHALVADHPRGTGGDVEHAGFAVIDLARLDSGLLADDEQLAFEGVLIRQGRIAGDEHLTDHRLHSQDACADAGAINGHVPPAQHTLPLGYRITLQHVLAEHANVGILRQEDVQDTVVTDLRQFEVTDITKERVRNLDQDTRTVAFQRVGANGTPMGQVHEDLQTLGDDVVRFSTLDVDNKSDTARIMFVAWIVEALLGRQAVGARRPSLSRHAISIVSTKAVLKGPDVLCGARPSSARRRSRHSNASLLWGIDRQGPVHGTRTTPHTGPAPRISPMVRSERGFMSETLTLCKLPHVYRHRYAA